MICKLNLQILLGGTVEKAKNIIILTLLLALTGCGDDRGSDRAVTHGGTNRLLRGGVTTATSGQTSVFVVDADAWGRFFDGSFNGNNSNFQNAMEDFLYPTIDSSELGEMSGDINSNTSGVSFYGKGITLNSGKEQAFSSASGFPLNDDVFNESTSELRIEVHDSNVDTDIITLIPIHFNDPTSNRDSGGLTGSRIHGNLIQLVFEDELGKVSLEGYIQGEFYTGEVRYRNLNKVRLDENGEPTALERIQDEPKSLGNFIVRACEFFNVSNIGGSLNCN